MLGTLFAHLLNYIFSLYTAHILSISQYAILIAMTSIVSIASIPSHAMMTIATKFTSKLLPKHGTHTGRNILAMWSPITLLVGVIFADFYFLLIPYLSDILAIPPKAFLFLLPIVFMSPALQANIGILQGLQKFLHFSSVSIIESTVKLLLMLLFGFLGWTLYGALGAMSAGLLGAYITSVVFLAAEKDKIIPVAWFLQSDVGSWKGSGTVILITTFALALLANVDIVLAKYFFPIEIAAQYSALLVISRVIGYGSFIIVPVFFPIMAQSAEEQEACNALWKGLKITTAIALGLITLFALFPEQIVSVLVGNKYAAISPYIVYGGIVSGLQTIAQLCIYYFISINAKRFLPPLIIIVAMQITAMYLFHQSMTDFIAITLCSSAAIVASLLLLSLHTHKQYAK